MDARNEENAARMNTTKNPTTIERTSDREVTVSRLINGPPHIVFEAWTKPELLRQWWVPRSAPVTLLSCEQDVRVGGKYRLVFAHGESQMAFFGTYLEVVPSARLVWTNEEGADGGAVTTVTFEDRGGKTLLVMRDLHPSKEALDAALEGMEAGTLETFEQLAAFVATRAAPR